MSFYTCYFSGLPNNNLKFHIYRDLVVASPVDDYFLYIDDLSELKKVKRLMVFIYQFLTLCIIDSCGNIPCTVYGRKKLI